MATTDNGFLEKDDIQLEKISNTSSTKSNILLFGKNFNTLVTYLKLSKEYLKYLRDLINIENLINNVIQSFQNSKLTFTIDSTMYVETSINVTIGGITYKIERISDKIIEITNVTNIDWNVDKLIIGIKNNDGVYVYPKITAKNNKITIDFIDGILSIYSIIVI
jgi:hypothetical protein